MSRNEIILRYFFVGAIIPMAMVLLLAIAVMLALALSDCSPEGLCRYGEIDTTGLIARGASLGRLFAFAGIWALGSITVIIFLSIQGHAKILKAVNKKDP